MSEPGGSDMAGRLEAVVNEEALLAEVESELPVLFRTTLGVVEACTSYLPKTFFVVAETNIRDALSHLTAVLAPGSSPRIRFDHWASVREHLRRAALESYQVVLEDRTLRAQALLDVHRGRIAPDERSALRRELGNLVGMLADCRVAKRGDHFQANLDALGESCRAAVALVAALEVHEAGNADG